MNYSRIVPEDSFIGVYMQQASSLETSAAYDFWAAMWTLGSCIGRSVYVPRPHAPVYLNWYIMFVAESGITRKSTAVRMARDTVSAALGSDHLIEGRVTPEFLFDTLSHRPHTAIAVSELVTFLGRESYVIELPAMLTDLYDCPVERRGGSISRGERVIRDAFVTFLTASTPSWLRTSVNPTVIEGGFTSRCLFIHDEKPKRKVPWPSEVGMDVTLSQRLLMEVAEASQLVQRIDLLPGAMRRFETWYRQRDTSSIVPFIASFNSREDAHVLRAAACLCINDGTYAIDRKHIDFAIKLVKLAKGSAIGVFSDAGSTLKVAQGVDRIVQLLIEAGPVGIQHTRMYASLRHYMQVQEFKITMDLMNEMGMITVMIEKRNGGGRRGIRYARSNRLSDPRKLEELKRTFV